ncbi:MAG TPA: tol-pal system protein YbgF [Xanthobacteraceae bacterium]|nr:tol-pal system protein YbgF [Xanthobacteraceae bacterium]
MRRFPTLALVLAAAGLSVVTPAHAQMSESELVMRLNRLEAQVRQLTGQVEQLQYRNQQLEQQLANIQQPRIIPAAPQQRVAPQPQTYQQPQPYPPQAYPPAQQPYQQQALPPQGLPPQQDAYPPGPPPAGGRRGDAFDPSQNPTAPGAPRALGGAGTLAAAPPVESPASDEPPPYVGAPGGRQAGAPLDLGTMADEPQNGAPQRREVRQIPGALPPPPPRNTSATGQQMVMAPGNTPKDEYDLAYGYVLRKDYALAEESLRAFMQKYPNDRLTADAQYWLGETLFQRQRYRDAAEIFLEVTTKHEKSGKAPESLLRLGQSLAALKEKEAACATFAEIARKYPRAGANVKTAAEHEQKRVGCI